MVKVEDKKIFNEFYDKHNISDYFESDFKKDMYLIKFDKGEMIQNAGDKVDALYFMVSGYVKVNSPQENGKLKTICMIDDLEILGDIELFADMDYVNNVIAVQETYCLGLDMHRFKEVILKDPVFNQFLAKNLARIVLKNNVITSFNLLYSVETRVATYILLSMKDNYIKENLTELADLLATSYRHLHRVLNGMCEKGVLKKEGRKYYVIDIEGLKIMANESIETIEML